MEQNAPVDVSLRWVQRTLWGLALLLGALQSWAVFFSLDYTDGLSYLDLSDAFRRGDWKEALSPYWSPLYPGLLALGLGVLRPSPYWEFPALHLINFGFYCLALISFEYFLKELLSYYRQQESHPHFEISFSSTRKKNPSTSLNSPCPHPLETLLSEILFRTTAYGLFYYFSLGFLRVPLETPDMCVSALVYLANGLLLRIHRGDQKPFSYLLLGVVLGLGYWAKTVMLIVGLLLFTTSLFPFLRRRSVTSCKGLYLLSGLGIFSFFCLFYFLALFWVTGRFILGDSARLNYLRYVNGVSWYGLSPRPLKKNLKHPPRRISNRLPLYEFGGTVGGTYPRWYNPSYWLEGLEPEINWRDQLQALKRNVYRYYRILFPLQYEVFLGILFLALLNPQPFTRERQIQRLGFLLFPNFMVLILYSLIIVEKRYVAPFLLIPEIALIGIGSFSPLENPRRKGSFLVLLWMSLLLFGRCGTTLANDLYLRGQDPMAQKPWSVAQELQKRGLRSGDKVACVGYGLKAYWARLARVQIVADMPTWNVNLFWALDDSSQRQVIEALRQKGIQAIIAPSGPEEAQSKGWVKVGNTGYWVLFISQRSRKF